MKFPIYSVFALATLLAASVGQAQDTVAVQTSMSAHQVAALPYEHLADYTSLSGESETAFLKRVGPEFRAYADTTGMEACAEICTDGSTFGLVVGSNDSHIGCVISTARVLHGMHATGVTIHTHGREHFTFQMSKIDLAMTGLSNDDQHVRLSGEDAYHFSSTDFATGPGYLATPAGLAYQAGKPGTEIVVR